MADESNASFVFVRDAAEAATGYEVGEGAPPKGPDGEPVLPCVVVSLNRDREVSYTGGIRALVRDTWLVKYVGPDDGSPKAREASDAIDRALRGARHVPGPFGTTIYGVRRAGKVRYPEYVQDGPDLVHRGGLYEVTLLPASG